MHTGYVDKDTGPEIEGYEPLEDAPHGPFFSLTAAFNRAIGANYGDQPIFLNNDNTDTELDDAMQRAAKEAAEQILG